MEIILVNNNYGCIDISSVYLKNPDRKTKNVALMGKKNEKKKILAK